MYNLWKPSECSENCNNDLNDFKNNSNLKCIYGFCTVCGERHKLKKKSTDGIILHGHNTCYSAYSPSSKIPLQLEKERGEKHRPIEENNLITKEIYQRRVEIIRINKENELRQKNEDRVKKEDELRRKEYNRMTKEEKLRLIEKKEELKTRRDEKRKSIKKEIRRKWLLSNNKVYDNDSNLLFCPHCNTYSVKYSDKWSCNECDRNIVIKNGESSHPFGVIGAGIISLELNFTKNDKNDIYEHYGIEALVELTGKSQYEIEDEEEELRIKEERRKWLLSNKKVYDDDSNLLFCPHCNTYSTKYSKKTNEWSCNRCNSIIEMMGQHPLFPFATGQYHNAEFNITNDDRYKINMCYGIESLVQLTGDARHKIERLIGSCYGTKCRAKGDACPYYDYLKPVDIDAEIELINNSFAESKDAGSFLRNEIEGFLDCMQNTQPYLNPIQQKLLDYDYAEIIEMMEYLTDRMDIKDIAVADTNLTKGEKISLREDGEILLAESGGDEYDGFCWNNAKKDDLVGVCAVPSYALNQLEKSFTELKKKYEKSIIKK